MHSFTVDCDISSNEENVTVVVPVTSVEVIGVLKATFNIYDPKVIKIFTCRDYAVTRVSQINKMHPTFCRCSFASTFFKSAIAKFGIRCLRIW